MTAHGDNSQRRHTRQARSCLPSTAWQVWTCAVLDALDDARAELDARELEALLDVVATKVAYLYVARLGLLDNDEAAA